MTVIAGDGRYLAADSAGYSEGQVAAVPKIFARKNTRVPSLPAGFFNSELIAICGTFSAAAHFALTGEIVPGKTEGWATIHVFVREDGTWGMDRTEGGASRLPHAAPVFVDGQSVAIGAVRALMADRVINCVSAIKRAIEFRISDGIAGPVQFFDTLAPKSGIQWLATQYDLPHNLPCG